MYLKKLYQHHKGWFFFVVFFIASQVFINYKHGVVFSPFYHYGMYSEIIKPQKKYALIEINTNGKILQTKDFSPQEWDKITSPILLNNQQQQWNNEVYNNTIKRLLHVKDSTLYTNHYTQNEFYNWYKSYLQGITKTKIDSLNIRTKNVSF